MNVNTPNNTDCPNCYELYDSECVVNNDGLPSLGLPGGSRLSTILKYINNKIKDFTAKFKKVIYNVEPIFDTGIPVFTYTDESCGTEILNMNIPLFLNGKDCFEYDVDVTQSYTAENAYVLFFNDTRSGGVIVEDDDTIQITEISGVALGSPLVIKNPGEEAFTFTTAILQNLLSEVNTLTTSTFTDIVTDVVLTQNNDVGLGLVPSANAGATLTGNLTFKYDILDAGLVLKETVTETILNQNVTGVGITTINTINFSVNSSMGVSTFYNASLVEITDQEEIDALIQLIVDGEVRPICCPDCGGAGGNNISMLNEGVQLTGTLDSINVVGDMLEATNVGDDVTLSSIYTGADVDCGALNLATSGDSMADILQKICARIDTIGQFFNILQPVDEQGDPTNLTINGTANSTAPAGDVAFFADRIGCTDDIIITINSPDGIQINGSNTITLIANQSLVLSDWSHPVGLPVGSYNATLTWSGCSLNKVQNVTFNLV